MARMSIDDMLGRDPRLLRLAKACGWSRRETAGCLVLDVWPLCYDRERPELFDIDIDIAADMDGFAQLMVNAGLAMRTKPGRVKISGARDRIKYLQGKREAGQRGGLKSAEQRGKDLKQNSSTHPSTSQAPTQAVGNPSAPDLPSASALPSAPDLPPPSVVPSPPEARTRKPRKASVEVVIPEDWKPTDEHAALAMERGADLSLQAQRFRAHALTHDRRCVRWGQAFTTWLLKSKPEPANQSVGTRNGDLLEWQMGRIRQAEEAEALELERSGT